MILPVEGKIAEGIMMTDCIHHTPGRLRTMWPQLKNNPGQANAAEAALRRIDGVISVKASAFTGNLFIRYDASCIRPNVLLGAVQQVGKKYASGHGMRRSMQARQSFSRPSAPRVLHASANPLSEKLLDMLVQKFIERSAIALIAAVL